MTYSVIIPAAGLGSRMKSFGPKSLIRVGSTTILANQLEIIRNALSNPQIILVAGFDADYLMNNTPRDIIKVENSQYQTSNVVRSIGCGLRAATGDAVLIIYGDLVFNRETLDGLEFGQHSFVLADTSGLMSDDEVGCVVHNSNLEQMVFDLPNKWGQILYVTGKELHLLQAIAWNRAKGNFFGFEAINEILERKGKLKVVTPVGAKITDVDSSKDIERAREILI